MEASLASLVDVIVDRIPGLVATLTPAGEVEGVHDQVHEYCGRTLEELKQWGTSDTVHLEDLPRVIEVITQSMASGDLSAFHVYMADQGTDTADQEIPFERLDLVPWARTCD